VAERASSRLVIAVVRVVVALMAVACRAEAARDQDPTPATSPPNERSEATIGIVEVSYRTAKHQRLVDVYVSGQGPFTFLIDTGVTGAAIDLDLARRLGIHLPGDKVDTLTKNE
jgi:predicted aspartyl protease